MITANAGVAQLIRLALDVVSFVGEGVVEDAISVGGDALAELRRAKRVA